MHTHTNTLLHAHIQSQNFFRISPQTHSLTHPSYSLSHTHTHLPSLSLTPPHIPNIDGTPPPTDVLFAKEWIETNTAQSGRGGDRGGGGGGGSGSGMMSGSGPGSVTTTKDFYNQDLPGFIFSAPGVVIEEMFARSLFGLPTSMKVRECC